MAKSVPNPVHVTHSLMFFQLPVSAPVDPYKEGVGVHGIKGARPPNSFKDKDDFEGIELGLEDKWAMEALRRYLWANGEMVAKSVSNTQLETRPLSARNDTT